VDVPRSFRSVPHLLVDNWHYQVPGFRSQQFEVAVLGMEVFPIDHSALTLTVGASECYVVQPMYVRKTGKRSVDKVW
jgi:hypothetical protein